LHDAAKAHRDWQVYIRDSDAKRGPSHSPLGAALFGFCAEKLIPLWTVENRERELLRDMALDWTRAVYDHHGRMGDLENRPPWDETGAAFEFSAMLDGMDLHGIFALVAKHFPGFVGDRAGFLSWLEKFESTWERRVRLCRAKMLRSSNPTDMAMAKEALRFPEVTSRLICSDRYHAGDFQRAVFEQSEAVSAAACFQDACRARAGAALASGADQYIVERRGQVQKSAVAAYRARPDDSLYTLLLPTGYGKTLTSLRIALDSCRTGRCNRIVYVGPYLSILSQAAREIGEATGIEVFQHHHLSIAEIQDDRDLEILDSWQSPILATTFNQLFRALFPSRAQETLRMEALHRSFIIIDEPQIIDTSIWSCFLRGLAVAAGRWGSQILLATATLPVLEGLEKSPVALAPEVEPPGRYEIIYEEEPRSRADISKWIQEVDIGKGGVAVMLNTVLDAVQVHRLLNSGDATPPFLLTALMLPGHKAATIKAIRKRLCEGRRTLVVSTQLLEAGVDLSFRRLFRALSVFPSIVQAAGRANRHGEGQRATVNVFRYVREGLGDTRRYVYRDETARRQTDSILSECPSLREENAGEALNLYFRRCWDENRQTACLDKFEYAAKGRWSALAGLEPFGGEAPREEVFVALQDWALTPGMQSLMQRFAPSGPAQLIEQYLNPRFRNALAFHDRKRFLALLKQFIVPVPQKAAKRIADQVSSWLWKLQSPEEYSNVTGLAHVLEQNEDEGALII
jgi:CRISPR-associated helicase Cas3